MGSKVIGFRCPDDLAEEFDQYCDGAGKTTGEVLRKLVDDLIYPLSGRERLKARRERPATSADPEQLYGVSTTEHMAELVNAQIKEQQKELREQFDRLQKQLEHDGRFGEQMTKLRKLLAEAVSVMGEDLYLMLLSVRGHEHDPVTGAVTFTVKSPLADRLDIALEQAKAWEFTGKVAEMFEPGTGKVFPQRLKPTVHRRRKG